MTTRDVFCRQNTFKVIVLALDLLLSIWRDGQLHTLIYDKRDDFNFHITNFPFLSSNIPSSPAYGVLISQLIRYSRAWSSYECFILRARRLSSKLLKQGYLAERLKSSFRKFYGRYGDLIQQCEVSLSRMLNDILILDQQWLPNQSDFPPISWPWYRAWPSPIMSGFHGAFATGVACQQGTLTLPDTWFRPPFLDLLMLQLLSQFLELAMSLLDFSPRIPLGTFSILLCKMCDITGGSRSPPPRKKFGLKGVKSCNFRQNKHGNGTFIKARNNCVWREKG